MGEGVFLGSGTGWLVAGTLVFGIAIGWLIWGGRRATGEAETVRRDPASVLTGEKAEKKDKDKDKDKKDPCPASLKLGAVESEIRSARALLEEHEEEAAAFSEELSVLGDSIKRANGRLKLVQRAVKRASSDT